ncbi:MAG: hypothetical protein HY328_11485 [Chloroflexi bacterium]|nr:hypothetical protein [Chloroflexota bacterium]
MLSTAARSQFQTISSAAKGTALLVVLENVGYISGLDLPDWAMTVVDTVTEEYAKLLLRLLGAHRRYDRVVILEDAEVSNERMAAALFDLSKGHRVDLLLLVHGQKECLVAYRGESYIDGDLFNRLLAAYRQDPSVLNLGIVYGVNCYGASLAPIWLALGADAVNGAVGVNWFPEPSLSLFLARWLNGAAYSEAVETSFRWARRVGKLFWPDRADGCEDPHLAGSRQIVYGRRDVRIFDPR